MENDEIYPEPGTACRHFNMIEMLKVEENKKKGGIGVSSKTKPVAEAATTSKATTKPTASGLLAVKAEEKRKRREKWKQRQISDEPEAALDLLDDLDDNPEKSEEMQEVWR